MGKILGIDYGEKRTGLAQTDDDKIIAVPLETVETKKIFKYLNENFKKNSVESFVIGEPKTLGDKPASISNKINEFLYEFSINEKKAYLLTNENFFAFMFSYFFKVFEINSWSSDQKNTILERIPMKKLGNSYDIANAVGIISQAWKNYKSRTRGEKNSLFAVLLASGKAPKKDKSTESKLAIAKQKNKRKRIK